MDKKYAYVTVLYGSNEYFLGTLMLGFSLSQINSPHAKIVMVTPDVNKSIVDVLSDYFIIIPIDYIRINSNHFADSDGRFNDVFTKLQVFNLTQYEKIMMLDSDMYVLKNMDHLFDIECPAALFKIFGKRFEKSVDQPLGSAILSSLIKIERGFLNGTINAGLVLLKPSTSELSSIIDHVTSSGSLGFKLKNPEQDYLSWRYRDRWHFIGNEYNYQFSSLTVAKNNTRSIHGIYNLHYSWILKPWDLLFENKYKVASIIEKMKKSITFYLLWVDDFRLLETTYGKKGIVLKELFDHSGKSSDRIDKLLAKLKHGLHRSKKIRLLHANSDES